MIADSLSFRLRKMLETNVVGPKIAEMLPLGLIMIVGTALRLFYLGYKSLWLDEASSFVIASKTIPAIVQFDYSQHPRLYYILLHFWLSVGQTEFIIRLPSAIFGILSILVLFKLSREWGDSRQALWAALLLSISPLHVWYSQEACMYSLVCLCGLLSVYFYTKALKSNAILPWIGFVAATVAGLYAQYSMLLLLLAENWLVFVRRKELKPLIANWILAQGAIFMAFAPWLPRFIKHMGGDPGYHVFLRASRILAKLHIEVDLVELNPWLLVILAIVTGILLLVIGIRGIAFLRALYVRRPKLVTGGAIAAYVLFTVVSALPQGASVKRQLLIFVPYFLVLLAFAIDGVRSRVVMITAIVLLTIPALGVNYFVNHKEQWREVAEWLDREVRQDDVILIEASYAIVPFKLYYSASIPHRGIGVNDQLDQIVASYNRTWLLLNHEDYVDPQGLVQSWFNERYDLLQKKDFAYIKLRLYNTAKKADL